MGAFIEGSGAGCSFEIGFVLHNLPIGTKELRGKVGLMGFVFAEFEAVVHFHNPLSQFNLGAFLTSGKLGLFVQVGIFRVASYELQVTGYALRPQRDRLMPSHGVKVAGCGPKYVLGSRSESGVFASLEFI